MAGISGLEPGVGPWSAPLSIPPVPKFKYFDQNRPPLTHALQATCQRHSQAPSPLPSAENRHRLTATPPSTSSKRKHVSVVHEERTPKRQNTLNVTNSGAGGSAQSEKRHRFQSRAANWTFDEQMVLLDAYSDYRGLDDKKQVTKLAKLHSHIGAALRKAGYPARADPESIKQKLNNMRKWHAVKIEKMGVSKAGMNFDDRNSRLWLKMEDCWGGRHGTVMPHSMDTDNLSPFDNYTLVADDDETEGTHGMKSHTVGQNDCIGTKDKNYEEVDDCAESPPPDAIHMAPNPEAPPTVPASAPHTRPDPNTCPSYPTSKDPGSTSRLKAPTSPDKGKGKVEDRTPPPRAHHHRKAQNVKVATLFQKMMVSTARLHEESVKAQKDMIDRLTDAMEKDRQILTGFTTDLMDMLKVFVAGQGGGQVNGGVQVGQRDGNPNPECG